MWPWPSMYRHESCTHHIVSYWWTFMVCDLKIHLIFKKFIAWTKNSWTDTDTDNKRCTNFRSFTVPKIMPLYGMEKIMFNLYKKTSQISWKVLTVHNFSILFRVLLHTVMSKLTESFKYTLFLNDVICQKVLFKVFELFDIKINISLKQKQW